MCLAGILVVSQKTFEQTFVTLPKESPSEISVCAMVSEKMFKNGDRQKAGTPEQTDTRTFGILLAHLWAVSSADQKKNLVQIL